MRATLLVVCLSLGCLLPDGAGAGEVNRLTYLDQFLSPYYVHRDFPKLTTPQWVGEDGVQAVVVLAIDDMRDTQKYETFLRPVLERLKQIDGRAAVSIMTNRVDPKDPRLQSWLKEGLSLEVHTYDHPCPCLQGGDFAKARRTYERCLDLLAEVPGNRPVAFRMPCCDSLNTPSPRFWAEIFNRTTEQGHFLMIDSSVFQVFTPKDRDLPRALVLSEDGSPRFRRYIPFPSFVNTIEDYPYPYVIGRLCWQFPCMVPSDWEAQHVQRPNNPRTVEDLKLALDATVIKQGVFNLVFHPHGWIRNDQLVELIDYAVSKHGGKVKFLTFGEALQRINQHLLGGQSLRAASGQDNGVRLLDLNNDGLLDVVIGNSQCRQTRVWSPQQRQWVLSDFPTPIVQASDTAGLRDAGVRFGQQQQAVVMLAHNERTSGAWRFQDQKWVKAPQLLNGLQLEGQLLWTSRGGRDQGVRLRDVTGDSSSELIVGNPTQNAVFHFNSDQQRWQPLPFRLPGAARIVDHLGRDAGLRFVDVNQDGADDVLFSNEQRYSLHLMQTDSAGKPTARGWSIQVHNSPRSAGDAIPMIVRQGSNNGAWFHSGHLWIQNEDTHRLPDHVDRRSFEQLLEPHRRRQSRSLLPGASVQVAQIGRAADLIVGTAQKLLAPWWYLPAERDVPPPQSPDDALATITPRPGMTVELVAAEPLVVDPIAFDWGPDGRLWVVEMRDYPNGIDGQGKPGGRVKVLRDADGDGRYDRAAVFLDNLPFPTGVKVWRQGILVTAAPELFYAEDTDGDDQADVRTTLYGGFGQGNQQHRVNGLRWGLDNWLYLANGDSGGSVQSLKTGQQLDIRGRDVRIRPDDGSIDLQSGQTQFGRNRDDWGNWFGGNNSNPMWHYVLEDHWLRRNPHFAPPDVRKHVSVQPGASPVYPTSRTLARFNDFNKANRFTSACSPIVYRDHLLGETFAGNAFICEPVHNLVHREILTAEGVSFTSRRAVDEQQSEFLASSDNWFRPVMVRTGPDGALWVADMYRFVIEHPEWIPAAWQRKLNLRDGDSMGRIYRVYPSGVRPRVMPRLDSLDTAGLVAALDSPNGWQRDMAQQMLLWRRDRRAVQPLTKMAVAAERATVRLQALCTLDGLDQLTAELLAQSLSDRSAGVRRHAVRLAGKSPQLDALLLDELLERIDDADEQVRLQLAYALGESSETRAADGLARLALAHPENRYLLAAVMSSVSPRNLEHLICRLLAGIDERAPPQPLLQQLFDQAAAWGDKSIMNRALASITASSDQGFAEWRIAALAGMLDMLDSKNQSWHAVLDAVIAPRVQQLFQRARQTATNERAAPTARITSLRLLGRQRDQQEADLRILADLLVPQNPPQLQLAVVHTLGRLAADPTPDLLLRNWPAHSPALRAEILDVLLSRPAWTQQLLAAIGRQDVSAAHLGARRRQQLQQHSDPTTRRLAVKLLEGASSSIDRQEVVQAYQDVLQMDSDVKRGKAAFKKRCAACHYLDGQGQRVGPDLTALTDKSPHALLTAVLDPNRAVEDKYLDYAVITNDGRQVTGILALETSNSITLATQDGKQQSVLRSQIDQLRNTGKSLMPEGMERDFSKQELADIIAFVRQTGPAPKPFPGNQPALAFVRDDGSIRLLATDCRIYGPQIVFEQRYRNLGFWQHREDRAVWSLNIPRAGEYRVTLDYACDDASAGSSFLLTVAGQSLGGRVQGTGTWDNYRSQPIGVVQLPAGAAELVFRSDGPIQSYLIDLRGIVLSPAD